MINVGIVGWRGMVGSVLLTKMIEANDFINFNPIFFSTNNTQIGKNKKILSLSSNIKDAYDLTILKKMDAIVSCQGSNYTKLIHKKLRNIGWNGFWLDTSSELRMKPKSIIVLDPVNKKKIKHSISNGTLDFIGGNCTTSLMLMAIHGLIEQDIVQWIISMTYQSLSGAGSQKTIKMLKQMESISNKISTLVNDSNSNFLDIDYQVNNLINSSSKNNFFTPLMSTNILPWIGDIKIGEQTIEEWKGFIETNKIMELSGDKKVLVDGQCVRVNTLRCHCQALTLKLRKNLPIDVIENIIIQSNEWTKIIPNNKKETMKNLTPKSVSGTLNINIGKLRKLIFNKKYITLFTVGDQLLWGAAEPIRRTLNLIIDYLC